MSAERWRGSHAFRSHCSLGNPAFRHAQSPFGYHVRALLRGVELRVATGQMTLAKASKLGPVRYAFSEKSHALENGAIGKTHRVLDELLVVAIVAAQICGEAVGYVL